MEIGKEEGTKQGVKTFTTAEALGALTVECFNEEVCREWILKALHPGGAYCPTCGMVLETETGIKNFWELKRCECKKCGRWFSATTGTILYNTQLEMRQVYLLAVLLSSGAPVDLIARVLKISSGAVSLWKLKFAALEETPL